MNERDEWIMDNAPFGVTAQDGERIFGPVMRRKNQAGEWEYRRMTLDEERDYRNREAW